MKENDLYVKPEKCKWKVRKVRFLGVVIESERIKIEEVKVKGVLDWLTPKYVKNIQKFSELENYYYHFIQDFASIVVVVTTRPMSNSSTTSKSLRWISSGEHKLCNSQENLTGNHNSILLTIYIKYLWFVLRLCVLP